MSIPALRLALLALLLSFASSAAAQACSHLLLISGFFTNVHMYDACSGAFLRTLDANGQIRGAQAVRLRAGRLYVVAETTNAVLRYRADTFERDGTFIAAPGGGITGLDFDANGVAYLGAYTADSVRRYDANGALIGLAFAAHGAGLNGPDNGLTFGPDGKLYIPGFDSDSVVRFDPGSGAVATIVPSGSNGLDETRGILFRPDGQTFLVTGEASGQVLEFRTSDAGFVRTLISGLGSPTGIAFHPDGSLLVLDQGATWKFDAATGARKSKLVEAGAGGLDGATFLAIIPNPAAGTVDQSQVGTQYWLVGASTIVDKSIVMNDVISATGAKFGPAFAPGDVVRKRWGSLRIDFTSCTTANLSWDSTGANSAGFGTGGYALTRLLSNEIGARCEQDGFANPSDPNWFVGSWWGGSARSGEGLQIDRQTGGTVVVTWFTYRPPG